MPAHSLMSVLGFLLALTACGNSCSEHSSIREKLSIRGLYINIMAENKLRIFNTTLADATLSNARITLNNASIDSNSHWNDISNRNSCEKTQIHFICDRLAMYDFLLSVVNGQSNSSVIEQYKKYLQVTMDSSCRLWVCKRRFTKE